jgi:hypothetical protein
MQSLTSLSVLPVPTIPMLRKYVVAIDNPVRPALPFLQTSDSLMRWTPVFDESVRLYDSRKQARLVAKRYREWGAIANMPTYQSARVRTLEFNDNV